MASTPPLPLPLGRNFAFQVLRGTDAELQQAMPLAWGELYFGEDTGNLYIGTPGVGLGYVQIGDTSHVNDTLLQILSELKAMRKAMVFLATDGGRARPQDFEETQEVADSLQK